MNPDDPLTERCWEVGWDGHARAQRRRMARLTFSQKLDWLEEAHELVLHLARQRAVVAVPKAGNSTLSGQSPL